jgi:hypothetical protein
MWHGNIMQNFDWKSEGQKLLGRCIIITTTTIGITTSFKPWPFLKDFARLF